MKKFCKRENFEGHESLRKPKKERKRGRRLRPLFLMETTGFWWRQLDFDGDNWILVRCINIPVLTTEKQAFRLYRLVCEPNSHSVSRSLLCLLQKHKRSYLKVLLLRFGGDNWTRTSDPLHVKQVL